MSAALIVGLQPFTLRWVNSTSGSTNVRGLPPPGSAITGTMSTTPALPRNATHSPKGQVNHYRVEIDCPEPDVLATLRPIPGMGSIMGIGFSWSGVSGANGTGYLMAGVRLVADELPGWAAPLPDGLKTWLGNMAAATNSMNRLRLFGVVY